MWNKTMDDSRPPARTSNRIAVPENAIIIENLRHIRFETHAVPIRAATRANKVILGVLLQDSIALGTKTLGA
tara:strand:+ start:57549 stop:57764 length:216 start_codon:yes stop_codon:yes gene_type:complete